jgi:hypothetical protein
MWFSILSRANLRGASFRSVRESKGAWSPLPQAVRSRAHPTTNSRWSYEPACENHLKQPLSVMETAWGEDPIETYPVEH